MKFLRKLLVIMVVAVALGLAVAPASAQDEKKVIQRPDYKVGDRWLIKSQKEEGWHEIKAVENGRITMGVTVGDRLPYMLTYTEDLNLISGYGPRTGAPVTYAPHLWGIAYPLHSGKGWGGEVSWSSPAGGFGSFQMKGSATGWEKQKVGKLHEEMLRISYSSRTCWFSPSAGRIAKCVGGENDFEILDFKR